MRAFSSGSLSAVRVAISFCEVPVASAAGSSGAALVYANRVLAPGVRRNGERASRVRPGDIGAAQVAGENMHFAGQIDGRDLARSVVVVLENQLPAVARPMRRLGIAVESRSERVRVGAVAVHDVQLRRLIAQALVIESQIGDVPAVGRHHRVVIGPAPVGERVNGIVREVHAIDFAVQGLVVRIGAPVGRDQHALAVGA